MQHLSLDNPGEKKLFLFLSALQFPSESLGGAAEAFHSLLRILGPEAALESMIRAVGLLPPTELSA